MKLKNLQKDVCEKYTLRFENGVDYAIFTIDETGMFNCQSSFGNFNYKWYSFGDNFKEFLSRLDDGYLLNKLCNRSYFNAYEYIQDSKRTIIKKRRDYNLTGEQARTLWTFFDKTVDSCNDSVDIIRNEFYCNSDLSEILGPEPWTSEYWPEADYSPDQLAFVNKVYPIFASILKEELNRNIDIACEEA